MDKTIVSFDSPLDCMASVPKCSHMTFWTSRAEISLTFCSRTTNIKPKKINVKTAASLNEFPTSLTGGWCGVGLQEVSGLWDGAEVVPDQRETQHPCQGGGAVLEQLQQGRLLHPRPRGGEHPPPTTHPVSEKLQRAGGECDHGDSRCFSPLQIIVSWIGSQANIFEKQKVREIASLIRDTDRHGKARIVDTSEGEEPEEMLKVKAQFICTTFIKKPCFSKLSVNS